MRPNNSAILLLACTHVCIFLSPGIANEMFRKCDASGECVLLNLRSGDFNVDCREHAIVCHIQFDSYQNNTSFDEMYLCSDCEFDGLPVYHAIVLTLLMAICRSGNTNGTVIVLQKSTT